MVRRAHADTQASPPLSLAGLVGFHRRVRTSCWRRPGYTYMVAFLVVELEKCLLDDDYFRVVRTIISRCSWV